jgi:hypothetical protein
MEEIKNKINYLFSKLTATKKEGKYVHPFFFDILKVIKYKKRVFNVNSKYTFNFQKEDLVLRKELIYNISENRIKLTKDIEKRRQIYEVFDSDKIKKIYNSVTNGESIKNIQTLVNEVSYMLIPSTVKLDKAFSLDNFYPGINGYEYLDKKEVNMLIGGRKVINIAIIGTGPTGLFLALYLNFFYNKSSLGNEPLVRTILFDNRIEESKGKIYRKPFTRERPFATRSSYFSTIFDKIFCLEEQRDYLYFNINVLEYILFSKVHVDKIPIHFWSADSKKVNDTMKDLNIEVLFDCTGGRLMRNECNQENDICNFDIYDWISEESFANIPKDIKYELSKEYNLKPEHVRDLITTIPSQNLVIFNKNEKFVKNYFYASLTCYNFKSLKWKDKIDINIENETDLKTYVELKGRYLQIEDLIQVCRVIKDTNERNKIYQFYKKFMKKKNINNKDYVISFDIWHTYMRHSIECSKIIDHNSHKYLYIGAGDTIFHSHWVVGAGMNRTIDFGVKCSNLLLML